MAASGRTCIEGPNAKRSRKRASQPSGAARRSSRIRASSRVKKYGLVSGLVQLSSRSIVACNSASSPRQWSHCSTCIRTLAGTASGSSSRSASSFSIPLQFGFIVSMVIPPPTRRCCPACLLLHKFLQLVAQRLVGAEEQRLGSRLAQLQHIPDLPVIHPLILVHQHGHPLPLGQRHHMNSNGPHALIAHELLFD